MHEVTPSEIMNSYGKLKFIRAVARQTGLSREKVRKILVKNNAKILTNDESLIMRRKHTRNIFNGDEYEKAYLYGFVLGDVHVFRKSKFTLRAITHTTHRSFVELFIGEFSKYGKITCKFRQQRNEWGLSIDLDYRSFNFLEERSSGVLPQWLNTANFLHFLSGLIDSDGSILVKKAGKYFQYVVRIFGEDISLLNEINKKLKEIGFRPSLTCTFKAGTTRNWKGKIMRYNKDYYTLEIYRKQETIKLLGRLTPKHQEKIRRKEQALEIYKKNLFLWGDVKAEVIKVREQIEAEAQEQRKLAEQHLSHFPRA